jgi:hypothetical protein
MRKSLKGKLFFISNTFQPYFISNVLSKGRPSLDRRKFGCVWIKFGLFWNLFKLGTVRPGLPVSQHSHPTLCVWARLSAPPSPQLSQLRGIATPRRPAPAGLGPLPAGPRPPVERDPPLSPSLSQCGTCHSTSTKVLSVKHNTTNGFSTTIGSMWYTKGIIHSRVSFNSYNINGQINNNLRTVIK